MKEELKKKISELPRTDVLDGLLTMGTRNGKSYSVDVASLKGPKGETGDPGPKGETGDPGKGLTIKNGAAACTEIGDGYIVPSTGHLMVLTALPSTFTDVGEIRGPEGPKGDPGDPGPKGDPFRYSDFTPEQLASLKGPKGDPGNPGQKGDPFRYSDFTPEQLAGLKGPKGDTGWPSYQTVAGATPTVQLAWGTVHQLTDTPASLTVAMPAAPASSEVECVLKFTTGAAAPTVTWPSDLLWANGTPTVVGANATYEFAVSWDVKAAKCTVIGCEFKPTA